MPSVGELLADRYRVDGVLGAGGMATVYAATDLRLERTVAVKVLLPNLARDAAFAERFDREARILASVSHPSVAEVFDVERGDPDAGREPFYVMELCEGGSLEDRIAASGAIEPGVLVPIVLSVAAALGELHQRGLVHRDVKPANVLFTGGRPKLADFGLAKAGLGAGTPNLTEPGTAIGTPSYMAPELATGDEATVASDVYALAATTFHGLTGRPPRRADSLTGLVRTMSDALPTVSAASPRLGPRFDAVIAAGMAADPAARPSLGEFMSGLVSAVREQGPAAEVLPTREADAETTVVAAPANATRAARMAPDASRRTARAQRRGPRLALPVALVLMAALAVGLIALVGVLQLGPGIGGATASPPGPSPALPSSSPAPPASVMPSPSAASATPAATLTAELALERVVRAIDAARGGPDGLGGNEARDLLDLAEDVRRDLENGRTEDAAKAATRLLERARKLTEDVDDERAEALLDSIRALQALLARG